MGRENIETGCLSGCGLVGCGPFLFLIVFLAIGLILVPLGIPGEVVALFAGIAVVGFIMLIAKAMAMKSAEDALIRDAELKRAKRELEGDE